MLALVESASRPRSKSTSATDGHGPTEKLVVDSYGNAGTPKEEGVGRRGLR
jgi:hypothetical protein